MDTHTLSLWCHGGEHFLRSDRQTVHSNEQGAHLPSRFYDITPILQKRHRFCRSLLSHPHSIPCHPWHIILSQR